MRKIAIFGQISWTNFFGKFRFCGRFEKFFLSRISKNVLFRLDLPKKLNEKNDHFLPKCMDYPLWKFLFFWTFLKLDFSRVETIFSIPNIKKRSFQAGFGQKPPLRKMAIFGQKPWTNPVGKFSISWTFLKVDFCCLKSILFYPEYQETIFPD